jgi:hypothetical protein
MRMSKIDRVECGVKNSDARFIAKISPNDLRTIMLQLAKIILVPDAFTSDALSLGADDKAQDIFSADASKHDLLGWIIKLSYDHWSHMRAGRKTIGHLVSLYIDSHIRTVSADKLRLMTLGDTGCKYASRYLIKAAQALEPEALPQLYKYAKDYESEEDKKKRLQKAAERKAKLSAKKGGT